MKKISFILLVLMVTVLVTGCFKTPKLNNSELENNEPKANVNESVAKKIPEPIKRFRPDTAPITKPKDEAKTPDPARDFVMTPELEIKFYLADKYDPGICYGMPTSVPQSAIDSMLAKNEGLANLIRQKYNLTDNLDIYNKIKQLNGFMLDEIASGQYNYSFIDGQCCILRSYEGKVMMIGKTISDEIISQDVKENPC